MPHNELQLCFHSQCRFLHSGRGWKQSYQSLSGSSYLSTQLDMYRCTQRHHPEELNNTTIVCMHVHVYVLPHHTVSIDTRVALTVIDVCLTVSASKANHTCAFVSIDNVL